MRILNQEENINTVYRWYWQVSIHRFCCIRKRYYKLVFNTFIIEKKSNKIRTINANLFWVVKYFPDK